MVSFRLPGSVVLRGGRGTAYKCHWCVWGALAVFQPHWVCPHTRECAFPIYTTQAPGCSIGSGPCMACGSSFHVLHKRVDSVWPVFCALPGLSSSGNQELEEHTLPRSGAPYPLCGPCLSFRMCRLGVAYVCSGELISSRDPPGKCQPSRISGNLWLETGSLFAVW